MTAAPLVCVKCGYTLTGLDESGNCPECAAAIANSITARDERLPTPRHADNAIFGIRCIRGAIIVLALTIAGLFTIETYFAIIVAMGGFAFAWLLWSLGVGFLSGCDPTTLEGVRRPWTNRLVLSSLVLSTMAVIAAILILLWISGEVATTPFVILLGAIASWSVPLVTGLQLLLVMRILAAQARRRSPLVTGGLLGGSLLILSVAALACCSAYIDLDRLATNTSAGGLGPPTLDALCSAVADASGVTALIALAAALVVLWVLLGRARRAITTALRQQSTIATPKAPH